MSVEKTFQGAWRISELHDDHLITRVYYFMTKREAMWSFRQEIKAR